MMHINSSSRNLSSFTYHENKSVFFIYSREGNMHACIIILLAILLYTNYILTSQFIVHNTAEFNTYITTIFFTKIIPFGNTICTICAMIRIIVVRGHSNTKVI